MLAQLASSPSPWLRPANAAVVVQAQSTRDQRLGAGLLHVARADPQHHQSTPTKQPPQAASFGAASSQMASSANVDDQAFLRLNDIRLRRSRLVAKAKNERREIHETALDVESDLVYLLDRVQFAEDQLECVAKDNKVLGQLADRARSVEAAWAPYLGDLDQLDRCRELNAIISARLSAVQTALDICADPRGSVGGYELKELLQRLEQEMLDVGGGSRSVVPPSDLKVLNLLGIVERSASSSCEPDQGLKGGKPDKKGVAAEEFYLRRQAEELTDRNEAMRRRLRELHEAKVAKEAQNLERETAALDAEVHRLEAEIFRLREDTSGLQSQIDRAEREMASLGQEVQNRRVSNFGLGQQLRAMRRTQSCPIISPEQLIVELQRELAEAYEHLAMSPTTHSLEEKVAQARRDCEMLEAQRAKAPALAAPEKPQELIARLARQRKEIGELKERVRREESRCGLFRALEDEVGSKLSNAPSGGEAVLAPAQQLGGAFTTAALGIGSVPLRVVGGHSAETRVTMSKKIYRKPSVDELHIVDKLRTDGGVGPA